MSRIDLLTRQFEPEESFHVTEFGNWPTISCPNCDNKYIHPLDNPFDDGVYCYRCNKVTFGNSHEEQRDYVRVLLRDFKDFGKDNLQVSRLQKIEDLLLRLLSEEDNVDDWVLLAFTEQRLVYAFEQIEDYQNVELHLKELLHALKEVIRLEDSPESKYLYALNIRKYLQLEELMHRKLDMDLFDDCIAMLEKSLDPKRNPALEKNERWLVEKLELILGDLCMEVGEVYQQQGQDEKALELYEHMFQYAFKSKDEKSYRQMIRQFGDLLEKLKEMIELMAEDEEKTAEEKALLIDMLETLYKVNEVKYQDSDSLEEFYKNVYWIANQLVNLKEESRADQILERALSFEPEEIAAIKRIEHLYELDKKEIYLLALRHINFSVLYANMGQDEKVKKEIERAIEALNLFDKFKQNPESTIEARALKAFYYRDLALEYGQEDPKRAEYLNKAGELIETILKEECKDWMHGNLLALLAQIYYELLFYYLYCEPADPTEKKEDILLEMCEKRISALERLRENVKQTLLERARYLDEDLSEDELEKKIEESPLIQWEKEGKMVALFNDFLRKVLR